MHLCVFEDDQVPRLRPLVETRAVYDLRLGMRSILDTAQQAFPTNQLVLHARPLVAGVTAQSHEDALVNRLPSATDVLFLNGRFLADDSAAVSRIQMHVRENLEARVFTRDEDLVAAWVPNAAARLPNHFLSAPALPLGPFSDFPRTAVDYATLVHRPWHLIDALRPALRRDLTDSVSSLEASAPADPAHPAVHESVVCVRPDHIHVDTAAEVRPGAILNAADGPIYIDRDAVVFEQAVLQGPCYVGPKTEVKVGASIEGAAFGYYCKVGGEVHDTVIHSLSNKSHPGFLGHAYLGSWCNLGADTNVSNLRNDYGDVTAYAPEDGAFVSTDRQFAGLFMGDHSKCGINTMFNTGTVVGSYCNLYGGDFLPRYLPPFSWGGPSRGFTTYRLGKALSVAKRVMSRRNVPFTEADHQLLSTLFEESKEERAVHHGEDASTS